MMWDFAWTAYNNAELISGGGGKHKTWKTLRDSKTSVPFIKILHCIVKLYRTWSHNVFPPRLLDMRELIGYVNNGF